MKILYGIQATGNGHITRARVLGKALAKAGIEVDFLFSGRERQQLFQMEDFGQFECRRGMTFVTSEGKINHLKTALKNNIFTLIRDIYRLDLNDYDLILSDFEPVSAWAAKLRNKPSIAINHQSAFDYDIPISDSNFLARMVMKYFAPTDLHVGQHWHHFNQPILPPIIEPSPSKPIRNNKILVYLAVEELQDIKALLANFKHTDFYIYHRLQKPSDIGNLHLRPFSRKGFQNDLADCSGVITNAGFELPSEALSMGKKLLVRALAGQMEQQSNAAALEQLGLASSMNFLDRSAVAEWLSAPTPASISYPYVAGMVAQWLQRGNWQQNLPTLCRQAWQTTTASTDNNLFTQQSTCQTANK